MYNTCSSTGFFELVPPISSVKVLVNVKVEPFGYIMADITKVILLAANV